MTWDGYVVRVNYNEDNPLSINYHSANLLIKMEKDDKEGQHGPDLGLSIGDTINLDFNFLQLCFLRLFLSCGLRSRISRLLLVIGRFFGLGYFSGFWMSRCWCRLLVFFLHCGLHEAHQFAVELNGSDLVSPVLIRGLCY